MSVVALHEIHLSLGAKMGPFGGWDMPIEYSTGTVAEHTAVRNGVGLFDVSHMGKVRILGAGAYEFANSVFANDIDRIQPGQAQYSMLCNEAGGIIDDLIVYLVSKDEIRFIPNAGNASTVVAHLEKLAPVGIMIENNHLSQGIIAVQGPKSAELLAALGFTIDHQYMEFVDAHWNGFTISICRTGYTGEHGFELVIENSGLVPLWNELLNSGSKFGVLPCGLGARDTLRTEMGYVLHGQDISTEISPVQARTGWAVGWDKPSFSGREALLAEKAVGAKRLAGGLLVVGKGIPRSHMQVKNAAGEVVGETTSGTFSPTLQKGIALGLFAPSVSFGDTLFVDVRGRDLEVVVTRPPFVSASPK